MGTLGAYTIVLFSNPASSAKFLASGFSIFGGPSSSIYDPNISGYAYNSPYNFGYIMTTD